MDPITDIFRTMHVTAFGLHRLEATAPWGVIQEKQTEEKVTPSDKKMSPTDLAHFAMLSRGNCWLSVEGIPEPIPLTGGDCFLLARGTSIVLRDSPRTRPRWSFREIGAKANSNVAHYGGGGAPTTIVCGSLSFDRASVKPITQLLPSFILIKAEQARTLALHNTMQALASEMAEQTQGSEVVATRLAKGVIMGKLENKVAVITGGSSGIGLAAAKRFVEEGAHVVITGRREKELKEAAAFIKRNVTTVVGDVSRLEDLDRLYAVVKEKHGHIDVLFANAGAGTIAPLAVATEAHFDQTFDVNVKGVFFTVQKALPLFKDGGSIILTSSNANVLGVPAFTAYAASKAAVRSFARGWTMELKDRKIRVNSMSPGPIETPALEKAGLTAEQAKQAAAQFASQVPLGRRGKPEEIAAVVVFLASDESSFITGVDLAVDGGMAQV